MLARKRNKRGLARFLLPALLLALLPVCALAQTYPTVISTVPSTSPMGTYFPVGSICPYDGLTYRIVTCIGNSIYMATDAFLVPFVQYMANVIAACCLLAVVLMGWSFYSGKAQYARRELAIVTLKIAGIIAFELSYRELYTAMMNSASDLVDIVMLYTSLSYTNYCPATAIQGNVWIRVDCALDQLIGGIFPGSTISNGMAGVAISSVFSGAMGFAFFSLTVAFVVIMILAVVQAMHIFLSALLAIAILFLAAPMVVPTILFRATKGYFEKWLRLLFGVILQPMFLFAYLTMLLGAFEIVIFTGPNSVYRVIECDRRAPGYPPGAYISEIGGVAERSGDNAIMNWSLNVDPRKIAGQLGSPNLEYTGSMGKVGEWRRTPGQSVQGMMEQLRNPGTDVQMEMPVQNVIDYEYLASVCVGGQATQNQTLNYLIRVLLAMFTAVAIGYVFYAMLSFVPYLGSAISGEAFSGTELKQFMPQMKGLSDMFKGGKKGP